MIQNGDQDTSLHDASDKGAGKARKAASAFRTISEVAEELGVQQHVLRFWETKFTQVKPLKRGGGRRYYRPEDVVLLKKIHYLLYSEGYTIKGVQKLIKGQGKQQIVANELKSQDDSVSNKVIPVPVKGTDASVTSVAENVTATAANAPKLSGRQRVILEAMLGELKEMRSIIKGIE
jgi:DNA-binding transcriptional MerR regulator